MVSRDIVKGSVLVGRLTVILLTAFVAIFAIQRVSYIVELAVLSSTILLCYFPLIIGIFHFNFGGKATGVSTIVIGFTAAIVLFYLKIDPFGIPVSVFVFFLTFFTFFLVGFVERKTTPKS